MKKAIAAVGFALWLGCGASARTAPAPLHAHYERSQPPVQLQPTPMFATSRNEHAVQVWANSCRHNRNTRVDVSYLPAPDGAAVVFTTSGDPSDLREHVLELTRVHNGTPTQAERHSLYDLPHLARFERVEHGAKMTLVAEAPNDSDALRRHVQKDVQAMHRKGCQAAHELM